MKKHELASSIILLIFAILVCIAANRLHVGTFHKPGSGFFPLVLGMVIGFLSLLMLMMTLIRRRAEEKKQNLGSESRRVRKVIYILAALAFYGLLLERIGYTLTTFFLFIFLLKGINPQKWYVVIGGALIASLGSYLIFQIGLQVNLPRGFLGM